MVVNPFWFGFFIGVLATLFVIVVLAMWTTRRK